MVRHLTGDGTRLYDNGQRARAATLQPGDTYTHAGPNTTVTVTGAPYTERVDTPQGHTVTVLRVPVQRPDGIGLVDTVDPDPAEDLL